MNELSRQFHVHRATISKHLVGLGVEIREVRISAERVEEARLLYEGGMSLAAIGNQLGFDTGTIHSHLRKTGVTMRDTHGRVR